MSEATWPVPLPDCVTVERDGDVALMWLNRPAKRNALSDELVTGMQTFFSTVPEDVRAIVVAGKGGHFCAGLDL
ncbi:MAG: enoyl-CoA hydratase-related protein, partial [Pseudomonadota bacterium]